MCFVSRSRILLGERSFPKMKTSYADQAEHRVLSRNLGGSLVLCQIDPRTSSRWVRGDGRPYGLDTPEGHVATVKRTLGRVSSPAILVGYSYGGSVITSAGCAHEAL